MIKRLPRSFSPYSNWFFDPVKNEFRFRVAFAWLAKRENHNLHVLIRFNM